MATTGRLIAFIVASFAALPAAAVESTYTKLDLGACRAEAADPDDPLQSGIWWCKGHGGMPVYVSEGDLRFFVSYGEGADQQPAATETLPQFNTIGPTIEWRLDDAGRARATILRFFIDSEGDKRQVLVVTRLGGAGEVCRVGFVDATLNKDANAIARTVADDIARRFRCGLDQPSYYGTIPPE